MYPSVKNLQVIHRKNNLIEVNGPTASGKTTYLAGIAGIKHGLGKKVAFINGSQYLPGYHIHIYNSSTLNKVLSSFEHFDFILLDNIDFISPDKNCIAKNIRIFAKNIPFHQTRIYTTVRR